MVTWKRSMIYCVSFISVFFIDMAIDVACGPEPDPYDYYISFFHNNIPKNNSFEPFYFNGYTFLNGYIYENANSEREAEKAENGREWARHLGNGVKPADVQNAMYNLSDSVESALYNKYLVLGKLPDSLKNNTFLKQITSGREKPALLYYLFSQGLEHITKDGGDKWEPAPRDSVALINKAKDAFLLAKKENDSFLRLRYFYQSQRLFHYSGNVRAALLIYENYITKMHSNSHVMGWALSLKAGEELRLGKKEYAAYLFSKVFAKYPERRIQAYYDFLDIKVPAEKVIKLTKNRAEKSTIYAIKGFHSPHIGLDAVEKVYKTDPKSNLIIVLLVREINKIEEGYLTPKINGNGYYGSIGYYEHSKYDSVKTSFANYIPKLKAFCERLASENKYPEPELGCLASAYLSWVQQDPNGGFKALAALNKRYIRGKLYDEKQLITLLLLSQSIKKIDGAAESKLLPALTWLDKKVKLEAALKTDRTRYFEDYDLKYYSASSRDFYAKILAPLYFKQKDTLHAALCILKSERTIFTKTVWSTEPEHGLGFDMPRFWQTALHSYHLKKILSWERSRKKTLYLSLLMKEFRQPTVKKMMIEEHPPGKSYYQYKSTLMVSENTILPAIYDLLGTSCLREQKYSDAVKAFKQLNIAKLELSTSDAFNDSLSKHYRIYPNAFIDNLRDYPKVYSSKKNPGYSKLSFAETMAKLEREIKTRPVNAAKCYYKIANGLYNTSYYGNAWYYTAYSWANDDQTRTKSVYYDSNYLRTKTAEAYFLKACSLSNNPEFKARCVFMAAKCKQNQKIYPKYPEYIENEKSFTQRYNNYNRKVTTYMLSLRRNIYFSELKNNYSKTVFYKLAVGECSYFRDFLKSANKK